MDDFLIASSTFNENCRQISSVLNTLKHGGITVNLKKFKLLRCEMRFLGRIISLEGIMPDPEKTKCIQEFQVPKNFKQLKSFLGLCSYYQKFQ